MLLPFIVITPPTATADQLWGYVWYIIIVVIGAIFATEYAAWRITRKVKDWEQSVIKKAKDYEKKIEPLLDMASKINPEQVDGLLKAVADVAGTVKNAIEKPKNIPKPEAEEEKETCS